MTRKREPKQGSCKAARPKPWAFPKREKETMRERRVTVSRSRVKRERILGPPGKEPRLEHLQNWLWTVPTTRELMVLRGFLSKASGPPGTLARIRELLVFLSCPWLLSSTGNVALFRDPRVEYCYHFRSTYLVLNRAPGALPKISTLISKTHFTGEETEAWRG